MAAKCKAPRILFLTALALLCAVQAFADIGHQVRITATDPVVGEPLAVDQQLFLRVSYTSEVPLRLLFSAYRDGKKLEFGFYSSQPELQAAGQEEVVGWIGFSNVTHIDEVRVAILDAEQKQIAEISQPFNFSWEATGVEAGGEKADWVDKLQHHQEWRRGNTFDPTAQKKENVIDLLFFLNSATIPLYLFMQVYALRKFRGRWRELATIPLLSLLPLVLGSIIGFGMDLRYWVVLVFRGIPFALAYIILLWLARRKARYPAPGRRQ